MASLNISPEELKAVEQTRQRLFQLSNSIGSLKHDVLSSHPLPNLDSLQASADILQHNISSLLDIIASKDNREAFSRIVVHPSTNFPGRTQEGILYQLLRKKAEPGVEASLDEGRKTFRELCAATSSSSGIAVADETKVREDLVDKWLAARDYMLNERIPTYMTKEAPQPFTEEEVEMGIENVRTGLRQKVEMVDDPDSDDDGEDEDEDEDAGGAAAAGESNDVVMLDGPLQPTAAAAQGAGLGLGGL
ncbi:hypothetical protein PG997_012310 [Apiospora hydei]|uniref:Mediator of RNA polymerase II transcription subunit 8 n=1 Tax=Apiospora hydei TaxID=1337664 RepID=A0ABR1V2Z8_9PEZI